MTRSLVFGAVLISSLLLAACGGDDEQASSTTATGASATTAASDAAVDTTGPDTTDADTADADAASTVAATTAPAIDAPDTTQAGGDGGDGDTIFVSSFDEMPDECVDMLEDFLRDVEPIVSAIDWDTASSSDLQALFEENSETFDGFDEDMASTECDRYEFEDDAQTTAQMIPIAEQVAPGAVAWLTAMDQVINASAGGEPAVGAPATCDEAIAAIDTAIAEGKTMSNMPLADVGTLTAALTVLSEDCTPEQLDAFYSREDVGEFLS